MRDPGTSASRAAAVGIGLVLAVVCGLALFESHQLGEQIVVAERAALDDDIFREIRNDVTLEQLHAHTHAIARSPSERDKFRAAARRVTVGIDRAALMEVDGGPSDGTDEGDELLRLRSEQTAYVNDVEQMITLLAQGRRTEADNVLRSVMALRAYNLLRLLDQMVAEHRAATVDALADTRSSGRVLQVGTPMALLLTLVLLGGLAWVVRLHQRTVRRNALHDAQTGLPNRLLFADRAGQALVAAGRNGEQPVVMMLDLDRFKEVNDTLGHHAGDELLQQVSDRLVGVLRPSDTVARFGGDEFAILLATGGADLGTEIAHRIRTAMEPPFLLDGISVAVEVSVGIATADRTPGARHDIADLAEDLLRQADTAMYVAKAERCGFSHYAAGAGDGAATERLGLLAELREALDQDRLVLHYQPKVSASTGALTGVEALVRWEHPERGLIPPDRFIPLAEGTTLIHRLTQVVVQRALAFVRDQLDDGVRVPVAVNISARTLLDRGFPRRIASLLEEARVPAELLGIEITESTIMLDPERALAILTELRDMGVRLSVDDFGTGYSSMAYLKHLPVQELKVDRSFVRDMATDVEDATLVQSAIDLGHNLGLSVVAEGVEDPETLEALRRLGADDLQGYLFARPMPEEQLRVWIQQHQHVPTV